MDSLLSLLMMDMVDRVAWEVCLLNRRLNIIVRDDDGWLAGI